MKKLLYIFIINCSLLITHCYSQWIQQQYPTQKLVNDMFFTDSLNGWMCAGGTNIGDSGMVFRTSNGGDNWIRQYGAANENLYEIRFANVNTGYCAGGFQKILKTTNGGTNWNDIYSGPGSFSEIAMINADTLYFSSRTSDIGIYKTTNGGTTFTLLTTGFGDPDFKNLFFINEQTGWVAAGSSFNLRRTTNGGVNWVTVATFTNSIIDLFFINQNIGWLTYGSNPNNRFLKTTNGGQNWIIFDSALYFGTFTKEFVKIAFINQNTGWCTGSSRAAGINSRPVVLKTTNSGQTWGYQDLTDSACGCDIFILDSMKGWSYGSLGKGNKTTNSGGIINVVSVQNISITANNFSLYQNYPNPFNPTTTIFYEIPEQSYVQLKIYDILGKETAVMINEQQNAGVYNIELNASGLPSGVYFYKITAGEYVETKKMLLIK